MERAKRAGLTLSVDPGLVSDSGVAQATAGGSGFAGSAPAPGSDGEDGVPAAP